MRKYHHVGIPVKKIEYRKIYYSELKTYATPFEDSDYGIELFEESNDCPLPEVIKNSVHVAFSVDNIQKEIEGKEIIVPPRKVAKGIEQAFILERGIPIEFIKFDKQE